MTQMRAFREYAINGREKYWKTERADGLGSDSLQKWTLTIHEPTCRYAKHYADGRTKQDYFRGDEGLLWLIDHGFEIGGPHRRLVWQGCKVCGTFHREPEFQALALWERDQQAAIRKAQRERDDAREASAQAIYQRTKFIEAEQARRYEAQFKTRVDAAMAITARLAAEAWAVDNPETAALIPDDAPLIPEIPRVRFT